MAARAWIDMDYRVEPGNDEKSLKPANNVMPGHDPGIHCDALGGRLAVDGLTVWPLRRAMLRS